MLDLPSLFVATDGLIGAHWTTFVDHATAICAASVSVAGPGHAVMHLPGRASCIELLARSHRDVRDLRQSFEHRPANRIFPRGLLQFGV
jgi:hypothetical protein